MEPRIGSASRQFGGAAEAEPSIGQSEANPRTEDTKEGLQNNSLSSKSIKLSTWALKISPRPSVIPREARNLNLPLQSEMSRFRYAPLLPKGAANALAKPV